MNVTITDHGSDIKYDDDDGDGDKRKKNKLFIYSFYCSWSKRTNNKQHNTNNRVLNHFATSIVITISIEWMGCNVIEKQRKNVLLTSLTRFKVFIDNLDINDSWRIWIILNLNNHANFSVGEKEGIKKIRR